MAQAVQILQISDASNGVGTGPTGSKTAYRDDVFYMEKIGEKWAKERGLPQGPGIKYRLNRLPSGFAGYASPRENESKHIDRYLYGHPNGHFRSMNELWPHFAHLQEFDGSVGCPCKLCTGKKTTSKPKSKAQSSNSNSLLSSSPGEQSRFFAPPALGQQASSGERPQIHKRSSNDLLQGRLPSDSPSAKRRKMDDEGTPDIYNALIDELKDAGKLQKEIAEHMSPDWRAGHELLQKTLSEWSALPSFVPRVGEIVLFARHVSEDDAVGWDSSSQSLRRIDTQSKAWLERLKWEAGVVTQMPIEPITSTDLTQLPHNKKSVVYSGFRIEPLSEPGNGTKPFTKQHKYMPLHAIRPFSFWRECLSGISQDDWHPTIRYALTVANSFCVVGRYSFKGIWPEATVFARGVYIGSELVMVGDTVRLLPAKGGSVKDVLVITSIRLRFVKLDQALDGDFQSCLHVTGKSYSLDPKRSFGGIAKTPAKPAADGLPAGLAGYGQWFSVLDPDDNNARLELPFSRILGRYVEHAAVKDWFRAPSEMPPPPSSFQAVNSSSSNTKIKVLDFNQGLTSIQEARKYSTKHDTRINKELGKSWFWAETRIEQLDLHEVNGRFVGVKDENRKKDMLAWRQALKLLDGKKGGFEHYQAARKQREEEQHRHSAQAPPKAFGVMAAGIQDSGTDAEKDPSSNDQDDEDKEMEDEAGNDSMRAGAAGAINLINDDEDVIMLSD